MGVWEEFCIICAGPLRYKTDFAIEIYEKDEEERDKLKTISKKLKPQCKWLNKLYIISNNETIIKTTGNKYTDYGSFVVRKNTEYLVTPFSWHTNPNKLNIIKNAKLIDGHMPYGIVCHQECYNFLQKRLNYKLQFADVSRLIANDNCHLNKIKLYAPGDKHIKQWYDYAEAFRLNIWVLLSPFKDKQNSSRLLKIWSPLVKKFIKNPPRPSPSESAAHLEPNTILKGYDGNKYIVKQTNTTKKWVIL
jgi:hypothetical protein